LRWWGLALLVWGIWGGVGYWLPVDAPILLAEPGTWPYFLGTDALGRDILVRLLRGSYLSTGVALGATAVGLGVGVTVGLLAGYYGGRVDRVARLAMQVLWVVPSLLWAAVLAFVLGRGLMAVILAVGLSSWVETGRLIRVETQRLRQQPFVEAALALGYPPSRVLWRHLIPLLGPTIRVQGLALFATAILIEAGLGFVGLSVTTPHVSLGTLLYEGIGWLRLPQGQLQALVSAFSLVGVVFVVYLSSQKL
jgi:peptide/nickel transport system permease protein